MRAILIPTAVVAALAAGGNVDPAQAKGCIKGAIAGGLAGHMAGHSVLGAIGGCAVGRTLANRSARQQQQQASQKQSLPSGAAQGYGNQGYYSTGAATQAAPGGYGSSAWQNQGYGTRAALPPPNSGTPYGGATAAVVGNDSNLGSLYNGGAYHR